MSICCFEALKKFLRKKETGIGKEIVGNLQEASDRRKKTGK